MWLRGRRLCSHSHTAGRFTIREKTARYESLDFGALPPWEGRFTALEVENDTGIRNSWTAGAGLSQ